MSKTETTLERDTLLAALSEYAAARTRAADRAARAGQWTENREARRQAFIACQLIDKYMAEADS